MKTLLSISLLSVILSMCGGQNNDATQVEGPKGEATPDMEQREEAEQTSEDTPQKPEITEMPDTSRKQVIEHGAPDKSRNDSVKAAKTKGKF